MTSSNRQNIDRMLKLKCTVLMTMLLILATSTQAVCQPDPVKWGNVSPEELSMDSITDDPDATVIVLADFGTAEYDRHDDRVEYQQHYRVKLLSDAAYDDWGTVKIGYGEGEKIKDLKAQTLIPDGNGGVKEFKVDKASIFEEEVTKGYRQIRFTYPRLEPGAIVEYRYTSYRNGPYSFPTWYFHTREPVVHSEYRVITPIDIEYVFVLRNTDYFDVNETVRVKRPNDDATMYRWVLRDLPAIRDEPFMSTPANYRAVVDPQLSGYIQRGVGYVTILQTWSELADGFLSDPEFGRFMSPGGDLVEIASRLVSGVDDARARMIAVYDHVRTSTEWDDRKGYWPDQTPEEVLRMKSGAAPDINLTLISMLRAAGFDAHPVLLSSRGNGHVVENYPLQSQFDYLIAFTEIGGEPYLLDATDRLRPYDLLPTRVLNGRGWLIHEKGQRWIPVSEEQGFDHSTSVLGKLDHEGGIKATLSTIDAGYSALDMRSLLDEYDPAGILSENVLGNIPGAVLEETISDGAEDVTAKLHMQARMSIPNYAEVVNEFIYLNPMIVGRMDENPMDQERRKFPVELSYRSSIDHTVSLELPPGYEVVELPSNISTRLPDRGGLFAREIEVGNGSLVMHWRLKLSKTVYPAHVYDHLKQLYEHAVATSRDMVVLRKAESIAAEE